TAAAARLASTIRPTFHNLTMGLLVGTGGGVPHYPEHEVRRGDVVVGAPSTGPAVVHHVLGKRTADGGFKLTRSLARPPALL
ncbi:hypothetical protein QBC43DRAFT_175615, partial [Cladorrhinum sp. PSN259]